MQTTDELAYGELEARAQRKKAEILQTADRISVAGTSYYVRADGDDRLDGKTPTTAWRTLQKVSKADLLPGDGVFFRRGDLFRGCVEAKTGVTYAAYGQGEKPKFYGWEKNLAKAEKWRQVDAERHIWKWEEPILDCGTLVFNGGQAHARKLIPSYIRGQFVLREAPEKAFDMAEQMERDLDMFCRCDSRFLPKGDYEFCVPWIDERNFGELYLRCDKGNPGEVFSDIEALPARHMFYVGERADVRIDNLCLKYIGAHGVAAYGHVRGLTITNCEIGWIGGCIQHYNGAAADYPQGRRGMVTRYGNGVEVYGGCEGYRVENCYIYEVYDAGVTHQITTNGTTYRMEGIRYVGNLIENCTYSIEYFLEKTNGDTESAMKDVVIADNILRFAGYGWGGQRYNVHTPAHIKSWDYENTADGFLIENNVFACSDYRLLHIVANEECSLPKMRNNIYFQTLGYPLGQFGVYKTRMPDNVVFDENAEEKIRRDFLDAEARVYTKSR